MDYLLEYYSLGNVRVWGLIGGWVLIIGATLAITIQLLPETSFTGNANDILYFFLFNPALIAGSLLFFWLGFEWGFIPVFLSSFIVAFYSGIPWFWALVFGIAFVLGIAIYAMAYQGFNMSYDLRNFKSIAFYISIMFIGSIASSLGAFIWSFSHHLSAYNTLIIWKSWWSGAFVQAVVIIGPALFLFTPLVERLKSKWLDLPDQHEVSMKWILGAVGSITTALALFIFSGRWLGKLRVQEVMTSNNTATVQDVITALESFELISWISIAIILVTGYGAFNLISGWNKRLNDEVDSRTQELDRNQVMLQKSLDEKKILLKEIHHRVKNNLALMGGLLELQERMGGEDDPVMNLQTARSRIRSMAMAHEALYQHETLSDISMKAYIENIAGYTHKSINNPDIDVEMHFDLDDASLEMSKSIPLGLLVNEILINAIKHAFKGRNKGSIWLESTNDSGTILLSIHDNGVGLPEHEDEQQVSTSLGMTLIKKFSKQLQGNLSISSEKGKGTSFKLEFKI